MRWAQDDPDARRELDEAGATAAATVRLWRGFRERLGRQVEGARAPVRRQLLSAGSDLPAVVDSLRKVEAVAGHANPVLAPIVQRLAASDGKADLIEQVVAAISNKETRQLSQEDYGRASGVLEVLQSLAPAQDRMTVVLPNGERRELPAFSHEQALPQIRDAVRGWRAAYSLSPEQTAALLLGVVFGDAGAEGDGRPPTAS
jgi:hypothetical protein